MRRNLDTPPERTIAQLEYDLGLSPQRNFFGWLVDLLSPNLANTFPLHTTSIQDRTKISICNVATLRWFEFQTSPHLIRSASGLAALSFSGVGPVRLFLAPVG